jgi:hypothetical protein
MKNIDRLFEKIASRGPIGVSSLATELNYSRQYIHKLILILEEQKRIKKIGTAPKVYYQIEEQINKSKNNEIFFEQEQFLNQYFITIDSLGNKLEGIEAMQYWCEKQNLPIAKTCKEFIETKQKYLLFINNDGLIDGLTKLTQTKGIEKIGVNQLYYLDFYAIERFGKTRLGTLMHYAKQGQNKMLMKQIVNEIKQRILNLIDKENIEAIVFVPPTIPRIVQIMEYLENFLDIQLPKVKVEKIKTKIIIPQKALSKIFERVANAKNTFLVHPQKSFNHILVIDDAVGSGATINEIALKIKEKGIANNITGLAITGSYKGFEVISEI